MTAQNLTWSSYKHHHTAKYLIGITPQGSIEGSIFLKQGILGTYGAQLVIPSFTRGKKQLNPEDVELPRHIANVRIHVERVIGSIKQYYSL